MRLLFAINNVYRPWKLDVVCREISRAHHRLPQRSLSSSVLEGLVNWERKGIPKDAGTSRSNQFDLGRMCRLLDQFDNPQNQWPAVHVAGSKGEGRDYAISTSCYRVVHYLKVLAICTTTPLSALPLLPTQGKGQPWP